MYSVRSDTFIVTHMISSLKELMFLKHTSFAFPPLARYLVHWNLNIEEHAVRRIRHNLML